MKSAVKILSSVIAASFLQACVFDEAGTEYVQPDSNTSPVVTLNYDDEYAINNYLSFADNSADITVQLGSVEFTLPSRSEMQLRGFGGLEYDVVWKTSVVEDSRGIKTLRMGYYQYNPNANDLNPPQFHSLAKDVKGNIYLTEFVEQLKSDLGVFPDRFASPQLLFPKQVEVGDRWVTGGSLVPFYYDFSTGSGWTAELVSDNATAPISGVENCIVIKYYKRGPAYYMYLKSGEGIVEWVNSWEEADDGTLTPIDGFSIGQGGPGTTELPYKGYGWNSAEEDSVGGQFYLYGLIAAGKRVDPDPEKSFPGEEVNVNKGDTSPINDTDYGFYRMAETVDGVDGLPRLLDLRLPLERNEERIDFSDAKWDALGGHYYRPYVSINLYGQTYYADYSTDDGDPDTKDGFVLYKLNDEPIGPKAVTFMGQGVLKKLGDVGGEAPDQIKFTGRFDGQYFNANKDGLTDELLPFGLTAENCPEGFDPNPASGKPFCLPAARAGQKYRVYANYLVRSQPYKEEYYTSVSLPQSFYDSVTIYCSKLIEQNKCDANDFIIEFIVPEDYEGEPIDFILVGNDLDDDEKDYVTSLTFYLPVEKKAAGGQKPVARLYDNYGEVINGTLVLAHDPETNTEVKHFKLDVVNALASADPDGGPIMKYSWDFDDVKGLIGDTAPLGTYTYYENGEYTISLTVTDDEGDTDTTYRKVVISDKGTISVKNIANDFASGWFDVYIFKEGEENGFSRFVFLDKNEEEEFEVEGGFFYDVFIVDDAETKCQTTVEVLNGIDTPLEVDLDDGQCEFN
ncbi:PKD domain-containing protein [Spongiibacter sp. KMU-158]|uniref:PKD domain-containing protein n=1 Tax=Spongiibacter pelagi TaxID=2760804 RepID=A0A927BY78_9GAMM|nr:PKD domain-containing protein [Spongiibacter pelagi]MBD2857745.1 PKD domain-containing protein [Spongiibacter pelagi]